MSCSDVALVSLPYCSVSSWFESGSSFQMSSASRGRCVSEEPGTPEEEREDGFNGWHPILGLNLA